MSTYINAIEYQKLITERNLNQLIQDDVTLLDETEMIAIDEMKASLCQRFDTEVLFAAGAAAGYPQVAMYLCDIVLYHLHSRLSPQRVPELRERRYMEATKWLKNVREGELCPALPEKAPVIDSDTGEEQIPEGTKMSVDSIYQRKNYRY